MLTASDIQKKEFNKGFMGYKELEVDTFLEEIKSQYELIVRENSELKNRINMLNDKINYYSSIEDTLQKTLVVAQSTAEEVVITARKSSDMMIDESQEKSQRLLSESESKSFKLIEEAEEKSLKMIKESEEKSLKMIKESEEKAENIITNAEKKTEKIIDSARNQVIESKEEYEKLRKEIQLFKTKYKSMLSSQLEAMEYYSEKGNVFDISDDLEELEETEEKETTQRNLQWTGNISQEEMEKEKSLHLDK